MEQLKISFNVNGEDHEVKVQPYWTLLYVLRNKLGLTGAKLGCGIGECGSCTVIMDDEAVPSCLVLAASVDGKRITTIEGLQNGKELDPLQEAFIKQGAVQCGFCTPGMILSAKAFLNKNSSPTEKEIREALTGNLCRCTGYDKIINAIMSVVKKDTNECIKNG